MNLLTKIGDVYGKLTVLKRVANSSCGQLRWSCRCECGSIFIYWSGNLRSGKSRQCRECGNKILRKSARIRAAKHPHCGMSKTRIYSIWYDHKNTLCDEWQTFQVFRAAVGNPPDKKRLYRIDESKLLGPGNTQWLTPSEYRAMRLELKINEYVKLTGKLKEDVSARFHRISKQRQYQLIKKAKGGIIKYTTNCKECGKIFTKGVFHKKYCSSKCMTQYHRHIRKSTPMD